MKYFLTMITIGMMTVIITVGVVFANGKAALTLIEGEMGRAALQKIISQNPKASEFFSQILGIKPQAFLAMDPVMRQKELLSRLNAEQNPKKLQEALDFLQTSVGRSLGKVQKSNGEELLDKSTKSNRQTKLSLGKELPLADTQPQPVEKFVSQMVERGEISALQGQEFKEAVLGTDVEGTDVVRCISRWQNPRNRALYVETIVEGARFPTDGKRALDAIGNTISRSLGISPKEAKRRACILAGAGNIRCNAYGRPILEACK